MMLGNFNACMGKGANPRISFGKSVAVGSGGATSNAPFILSCVCAAQCATNKQPKLCATSTTFSPASATAFSKLATHSAHTGLSQSRCCTREKFGCAVCHKLCQ